MNIFEHDWPFNLKRPNPERFRIRRLALKRFLLGYPPRKPNETSYGDAINWEWLINCATRCTKNENILIVSRDGDYGLYLDGDHCILNDWLKREFRDRVGVNRKIELSNKLTYALRKLDETVTKEEEEQEERILEKDSKLSALYSYVLPGDGITGEKLDDVIRRILAVRTPKNDGENGGQ